MVGDTAATGSYYSNCDDARLVERFKRGDRELAFGALYLRYQPTIHSILTRKLNGDAHLAEDLAQEVMIRASIALPYFEVRSEKAVRRWLMTIAHNRLRKELSKRKHSEPYDPAALETELERNGHFVEDTASWWDDGGRLRELTRVIEELSPFQRDAVLLTEVVGLTALEAARRMGTSANSVRVIKHNALGKLSADERVKELRRALLATITRLRPFPVLAARRFALGSTRAFQPPPTRPWTRH